jgi:hypothetical protein
VAGRPAQAPAPAAGIQYPGTPVGRLATGHAQLVSAATRCHDDTHGAQLWRLTAGGWAAIKDTSRDSLSTGPDGELT